MPDERPLSLPAMLGYSLANIGYGGFYALNNFVLPLWLSHYTSNAMLLGLMSGTHSLEGAVIQPWVGSLSDRLRSPLGRRRPIMLASVPVSAFFLFMTPLAAGLSSGVRLPVVIGCIFMFTMTFNIAQDPYQALMPDITPRSQRGRVSGAWFLMGALGQVAILKAPLATGLKFPLTAVAMLLTTIATCAATRERSTLSGDIGEQRQGQSFRRAWDGLVVLKQARIYLSMFLCYGAGIGAVVPFLTIFIERTTACSDKTASGMVLILMLATAFGQIPCGMLCDWIGPKRVLILSMILIGAAAAGGLWVTTLPQVGMVLALAGLGTAAQNASAYPLLTRLVPDDEVGLYTGLQTTALSIAAPATIAITGISIHHGGFRTIFAVCGILVGLALAILLPLRESAAPDEIAFRQLQRA